jgi:hypothetical protein
MACNLRWAVPPEWATQDRPLQVEKIRASVRAEMDRPEIDTSPYQELLAGLAQRTRTGWQHRFFTTNWDYLLQREILRLDLKVAPDWLTETHVFHFNGTVEATASSDIPGLRAPFLLKTDASAARTPSHEFNQALQFLLWRRHFIVVGVSFSCQTDRAFLAILRSVNDDLPVGCSWWHVVDRSSESIAAVASRIGAALPRARITASETGFAEWVTWGMPELSQVELLDP